MNDKLRAAAELALEYAAEEWSSYVVEDTAHCTLLKHLEPHITAIRSALAEQPAEQDKTATMQRIVDSHTEFVRKHTAPQPAIPPGYKLVPVEPTEEAPRMSHNMRDFIEGMSVSVDVSTGDHNAHHRYFGTVTEVMDDDYDKHGVTLLVQDAKPNFVIKEAPKQEPSPTAGMNIAQRILHVGGRNNAAGYVEFGSTQAVEALVRQVIRDLQEPKRKPLTEDEIYECLNRARTGLFLEFARAIEAAHGITGETK